MGSSESTLVKMPHCWKSHITAQLLKQLNGFKEITGRSACPKFDVKLHLYFRSFVLSKDWLFTSVNNFSVMPGQVYLG